MGLINSSIYNLLMSDIIYVIGLNDDEWFLYNFYRYNILSNETQYVNDLLSLRIINEFYIRIAINIIIDEDDW